MTGKGFTPAGENRVDNDSLPAYGLPGSDNIFYLPGRD